MGRTLSAATATAVALPFTKPGHLLQIAYPSVLRYSSRGDISWNGSTWQANNLQVGALVETPNGATTLQVKIGNTDGAFGALMLAQAPQEIPVTVWAFYVDAPALADPVMIFSGVIEAVPEISEQAVTLALSDLNASTLFLPRQRISRALGFNRLMSKSRVIEWNGDRLELTRSP